METSQTALKKAIDLIIKVEGCETNAYLDPLGIPTICTGLIKYPHGHSVMMGDICDANICREYLREVLVKEIVPQLSYIPNWQDFGPSRQGALISFAWNVGIDFYNNPEYAELHYILANGVSYPELYNSFGSVLQGYTSYHGKKSNALYKRRTLEAQLWYEEGLSLVSFFAARDTYLKKAAIPIYELSDHGKRQYQEGDEIFVTCVREIPKNIHNAIKIRGESEEWVMHCADWLLNKTRCESFDENKRIDWLNMHCSVGKDLSVGEVLQYNAHNAPQNGSEEEKALLYTIRQFNALREAWNGPLGISGGYRPESSGTVLDIYPLDDSIEHLYSFLHKRWKGLCKIDPSNEFITLDTEYSGGFKSIKRP